MRTIADIFRSYGVVDSRGVHVGGTDKETNHRYGDAYQRILDNANVPRESATLMMEVGVADGASLLAWRDVFPNAMCVGMDIHPASQLAGELYRIEFRLGDQRSRVDCEGAASGRRFDLIVEDATHNLGDTLLTLLFLWPYVRRGGLYVVEEFADIGSLARNVVQLWPNADIYDAPNPFGGTDHLVVMRKPL